MNKRTFSQRIGDPNLFIFKEQVWDTHLASGASSDKACAICKRHIRYAFILKKIQTDNLTAAPEVGKLEIGPCCFHYFKKWNRDLYYALLFAYENEKNRSRSVERDKNVFSRRMNVKTRMSEWRKLKRQAFQKLVEMERANTSAPVADVLNLHKVLQKTPIQFKRVANALRWYDEKISELRTQISKL